MASLLVQPRLGGGGVVDELLGLEPQVDLSLGVRHGVAAVDDVPENGGGGARFRSILDLDSRFLTGVYVCVCLLTCRC